jgi:hypothetical protein
MSASVVINYCSNEKIFLEPLLKECLKFSKDIVVSYGEHLYNGVPEDIEHINKYKEEYPDVQFIGYPVDVTLDIGKRKGVINRPMAYFHNLARWTGVQALNNKEWVFIIDSDEIPEGDKVEEFLSFDVLDETECYKMANYWYFKSPENQAETIEDSVLLIHYKYLTENNIFGDNERDYLIPSSESKLQRGVTSVDNKPIWHHYSWVRTKEGLKHKVKNWAHSNDIFKGVDVDELIKFIFKDDNVNDVVHNYKYNKVENKFNILL